MCPQAVYLIMLISLANICKSVLIDGCTILVPGIYGHMEKVRGPPGSEGPGPRVFVVLAEGDTIKYHMPYKHIYIEHTLQCENSASGKWMDTVAKKDPVEITSKQAQHDITVALFRMRSRSDTEFAVYVVTIQCKKLGEYTVKPVLGTSLASAAGDVAKCTTADKEKCAGLGTVASCLKLSRSEEVGVDVSAVVSGHSAAAEDLSSVVPPAGRHAPHHSEKTEQCFKDAVPFIEKWKKLHETSECVMDACIMDIDIKGASASGAGTGDVHKAVYNDYGGYYAAKMQSVDDMGLYGSNECRMRLDECQQSQRTLFIMDGLLLLLLAAFSLFGAICIVCLCAVAIAQYFNETNQRKPNHVTYQTVDSVIENI